MCCRFSGAGNSDVSCLFFLKTRTVVFNWFLDLYFKLDVKYSDLNTNVYHKCYIMFILVKYIKSAH